MSNNKAPKSDKGKIFVIWKLLMLKKPIAIANYALILSQSAFGADLPAANVATLPLTAMTWSGFYAGLNAGGAWSSSPSINVINGPLPGSSWSIFNALASGNVSTSNQPSFIGGGQIGYNWLPNFKDFNIVLGLEADIQGNTSAGGNSSGINNYVPNASNFSDDALGLRLTVNTATNVTGSQQLNYLGTVRSRFGYLVTPLLLTYGTGGMAYGSFTTEVKSNQNSHGIAYLNGVTTLSIPAIAYGYANSMSTLVGWTAGGGLEWMFLPNWSLKAEYLYYDLGRTSRNFVNSWYSTTQSGFDSSNQYSTRANGNIARAGINYHFNWGSIPNMGK